jgi:hypothetical protein
MVKGYRKTFVNDAAGGSSDFGESGSHPLRHRDTAAVLRSYDPRRVDDAPLAAIEATASTSRSSGWAKTHVRRDTSVDPRQREFEAMTDFALGVYAGGWAPGSGSGLQFTDSHPVRSRDRVLDAGRGTATRLRARGGPTLTRVARKIVEADRVVIRVDVENIASRRIPEALGFVFEGIARKSLRTNDTARDAAIYSITSDDPEVGVD